MTAEFQSAIGSGVTYTYDNIGQLQSAVGSGGQSTENLGYLYDSAWNLNKRTNNGTPTTFAVDGKNQLTKRCQSRMALS